jgi:hypothetical protein
MGLPGIISHKNGAKDGLFSGLWHNSGACMLVHFWNWPVPTKVRAFPGPVCALMAYFLLNSFVQRDFSLEYPQFFFLSTNCNRSEGVFDGTDSQ